MLFPLPLRISGGRAPAALPLANAGLILTNALATLFLSRELWTLAPDTGLLPLATYSFVHAGLLHLLLNMWVLWVFGNPVNRWLGDTAYLAAYLGAVIAVGLAAKFLTAGRVLGSAGGVFAVLAMALWLMPRARVLFFLLALFPLTLILGLIRRPPKSIGWFVRWHWLRVPLVWGVLLVPLLEAVGYLATLTWHLAHLVHLLGFAAGLIAVLLVPKAAAPQPIAVRTDEFEPAERQDQVARVTDSGGGPREPSGGPPAEDDVLEG
jgi:membrane associated rhomboid family serine protease